MSCSQNLIKNLTNRVLDLVVLEIGKAEMQDQIKTKVIHPLLFMIYQQLYPYIYVFIAVIFLMFIMLIILLVFFIVWLRK